MAQFVSVAPLPYTIANPLTILVDEVLPNPTPIAALVVANSTTAKI
jgi:hypothetical protein